MDGRGGHYAKWEKSKILTARPHFYVGFEKLNIKLKRCREQGLQTRRVAKSMKPNVSTASYIYKHLLIK